MANYVFESHNIFFRVITPNKLNEFLNRTIPSTTTQQSKLEEDIYIELRRKINDIECNVEIEHNNNNMCDVYIKFRKINGEKVGHISFHLDSEDKSLYTLARRRGRIHAQNNKNKKRTHTLKINQYRLINENAIKLSVSTELNIRTEFNDCIVATLNVLNSYFQPDSPLYLDKKLTEFGDTGHKCLGLTQNKFKHKKTTHLQHTKKKRQNSYRIKSSTSAPWAKKVNK